MSDHTNTDITNSNSNLTDFWDMLEDVCALDRTVPASTKTNYLQTSIRIYPVDRGYGILD